MYDVTGHISITELSTNCSVLILPCHTLLNAVQHMMYQSGQQRTHRRCCWLQSWQTRQREKDSCITKKKERSALLMTGQLCNDGVDTKAVITTMSFRMCMYNTAGHQSYRPIHQHITHLNAFEKNYMILTVLNMRYDSLPAKVWAYNKEQVHA